MRIRTDDEVYRVDAVWLGPPKATMPWRARYVAWGVGVFVFLIVLTVERRMGISLGWSVAWGMVITILLTRLITSRISHERPLTAVTAMWVHELTAPRETTAGQGGAVSATRVRVQPERPRPGQKVKRGRRPRSAARTRKAQKSQRSQRARHMSNRRTSKPSRTTRKSARGKEVRRVRTSKQARA